MENTHENDALNNAEWWYEERGQQIGPVSESEIKRKLAENALKADTLVWKKGSEKWIPLGTTALMDTPKGTPPPLPSTPKIVTSSPLPIEKAKWYNDKLKLALSIVMWPVAIYGFFKTSLLNKKAKKIIVLVAGALFILVLLFGKSGPVGKGFFRESDYGYGEYSFGSTYNEGKDFLNYGWTYEVSGQAVQTIRRTGHFTVDGNTINCFFNDGRPPYRLTYKSDNGGLIIDEEGHTWFWDDPSKRNK